MFAPEVCGTDLAPRKAEKIQARVKAAAAMFDIEECIETVQQSMQKLAEASAPVEVSFEKFALGNKLPMDTPDALQRSIQQLLAKWYKLNFKDRRSAAKALLGEVSVQEAQVSPEDMDRLTIMSGVNPKASEIVKKDVAQYLSRTDTAKTQSIARGVVEYVGEQDPDKYAELADALDAEMRKNNPAPGWEYAPENVFYSTTEQTQSGTSEDLKIPVGDDELSFNQIKAAGSLPFKVFGAHTALHLKENGEFVFDKVAAQLQAASVDEIDAFKELLV